MRLFLSNYNVFDYIIRIRKINGIYIKFNERTRLGLILEKP